MPKKFVYTGSSTYLGTDGGFEPPNGIVEIYGPKSIPEKLSNSISQGISRIKTERQSEGDKVPKKVTHVVVHKSVKTIPYSTFEGCVKLEDVELPEGLEKIGYYAFKGCSSLNRINFPSTLKLIGDSAFEGCSSLSDVVLPEGLQEIGPKEISFRGSKASGTFSGCTSLKRITLPSSLKVIGDNTFFGCGSLKEIVFPEGLEEIGDGSFEGCASLTHVSFPSTLKTINSRAFYGCDALLDAPLPEGLREIGTDAFASCPSLKQITIPSSVKKIDHIATVSSTEVILQEGAEKIEKGAFMCSQIQKFIIPSTVKIIGHEAFAFCKSLRWVILPEGLLEIESEAFKGCTSLKHVRFPLSSLKLIDKEAFAGCTALEQITISYWGKKIFKHAFSGCSSLVYVSLEEGKLECIGEEAFGECTSMKRIELPSTLKIIEESAFIECISLSEIVLPNGLREICEGSFSGCTSLKQVTLPHTVRYLNKGAFDTCCILNKGELSGNIRKEMVIQKQTRNNVDREDIPMTVSYIETDNQGRLLKDFSEICSNMEVCKISSFLEVFLKSVRVKLDEFEPLAYESGGAIDVIISISRSTTSIFMEHILILDETTLETLDTEAVKSIMVQLYKVCMELSNVDIPAKKESSNSTDRVSGGGAGSTSETSKEILTGQALRNEFFSFWRALCNKLITSQSLPLKLFGWENIADIISESHKMAPPPRAYRVKEAGTGFVNGLYEIDQERVKEGGYVQDGAELQYHHIVEASPNEIGISGGGKKITLFRCTVRAQQWWFLSEVDANQPGTDMDVDYYQHKSKHEEEALPSLSGWVTCRSGVDPPPTLEAVGKMVPLGEERNTLDHQLAKWVIDEEVLETVLGSGTHSEVVSRSTNLIKFMAEMCSDDNDSEVDEDARERNNYCLQARHLLLAWKTCTNKADVAVSAQIYKLLVSILPSLPLSLAMPLLEAIQESLAVGELSETGHTFFKESEFSAIAEKILAKGSANQPTKRADNSDNKWGVIGGSAAVGRRRVVDGKFICADEESQTSFTVELPPDLRYSQTGITREDRNLAISVQSPAVEYRALDEKAPPVEVDLTNIRAEAVARRAPDQVKATRALPTTDKTIIKEDIVFVEKCTAGESNGSVLDASLRRNPDLPKEECNPTISSIKKIGDEAFDAGNFAEAVTWYSKAIEVDSYNYLNFLCRSAAYLRTGDGVSSLDDANMAILLNRKHPAGYCRKGSALHAMKLYGDAVSAFEEGLSQCPEDNTLKESLDIIRLDEGYKQYVAESAYLTSNKYKSRTESKTTVYSVEEKLDTLSKGKLASFESTKSIADLDDYTHVRIRLNAVIENVGTIEPVQLPPGYVESIKTTTKLGGGYFGEVLLGRDRVSGRSFAVKQINPAVFENVLINRQESIQKSFKTEIKVLSQLRHPNIAALYGYCMEEDCLHQTCLVYELAVNSSLDKFWEDDLGRSRLPDVNVRTRIALEVATALRYMHEGLDGAAACFHRDIKSGNVCLNAALSARIVDCGLSKYVVEAPGSISSAGAKGTTGYICPQYLYSGIPFGSSCDVFSFGVLLCELITGMTTSQRGAHQSTLGCGHYDTYRQLKKRRLEDDADDCVDWGGGSRLKKLSKLALKCMKYEASSRPSIGRVVQELQLILSNIRSSSADTTSREITSPVHVRQCRVCGVEPDQFIECFGNQRHLHCQNCFENHLKSNMNGFNDNLSCPRKGCDSRPFNDMEVVDMISPNVWTSFLNQRRFVSLERKIELGLQEVKDLQLSTSRQTRDLLIDLCAGNGLPCPRRFVLVEEDKNGVLFWRHPKGWIKNRISDKLYIYFVCSHSNKMVSDRSRIEVRCPHDWFKRIAPALNMSLILILSAVKISSGIDLPLEMLQMKKLDEWSKGLLDEKHVMMINQGEHKELVSNALSLVAEKAASRYANWMSELAPVYDNERKAPTFVLREYDSLDRYRGT